MTTPSFIVIPFIGDRGRFLRPGAPMCVHTGTYARLLAKLAAPKYAGIAIIEELSNKASEPRLVKAFGRVPALIRALEVAGSHEAARPRLIVAPDRELGAGRERPSMH